MSVSEFCQKKILFFKLLPLLLPVDSPFLVIVVVVVVGGGVVVVVFVFQSKAKSVSFA